MIIERFNAKSPSAGIVKDNPNPNFVPPQSLARSNNVIVIGIDYYQYKNLHPVAREFFENAEVECRHDNCQSYSSMFYLAFLNMCEALEDLREDRDDCLRSVVARKNFDDAFEKFKKRIAEMPDNDFWDMLGTSIGELKELAEKENCEQ